MSISDLSNFVHLNTMPLMQDELNEMLALKLKYFETIADRWDWENYNSISLSLDDISFITNISIYTKQDEEIQILFVERCNDENANALFTAIKKTFEIPAREVLSFQNVMILGIHHNSIKNPNQGYHNISIDMTVSNAAIENAKKLRGQTPIWETLFGVVLPYIPDINGLDPLIPIGPDTPDYKGLIGGIDELVETSIDGIVPVDQLFLIAETELPNPTNSYVFNGVTEIGVLISEYPQKDYGDPLSGNAEDWEIYNYAEVNTP